MIVGVCWVPSSACRARTRSPISTIKHSSTAVVTKQGAEPTVLAPCKAPVLPQARGATDVLGHHFTKNFQSLFSPVYHETFIFNNSSSSSEAFNSISNSSFDEAF